MQNVILVIHIIACLVMIGLVLLQKSEGGGLGIGGGGANSLMSGRGTAGTLVRATMIVGAVFFVTSLALTSIANRSVDTRSGIERALEQDSPAAVPSGPIDLFDPSTTLLNEPQTAAPEVISPPATDETAVDPSEELPSEDTDGEPANPQ